MSLLVAIIIGAVAGWLAGTIMKSSSGGLLLNIILGIAGSFVGHSLFDFLGFGTGSGWTGVLICSTVGAIILIALAKILFKKRK